MSNTSQLLLVMSLVLATASPARVDIGVIVLEPVSALSFFTRVGHAGTYLSNIWFTLFRQASGAIDRGARERASDEGAS